MKKQKQNLVRIPQDKKPDPDQNSDLNIKGFTTDRGLLLDLDATTYTETIEIARFYCRKFGLQGYLIAESSENNYHVIFNKYMKWKTVLSCLFNIVWSYHYHEHGIKPRLTNWAILQAIKQAETLRVSSKWINEKRVKPKPRILLTVGKRDNLIKDYREIYDLINGEPKKRGTGK